MRRTGSVYAGSMTIALLMAGCISPRPARQSCSPAAPQPLPAGELVSSRPLLPSPEVTALTSYATPAEGLIGSGPYRVLKPHEAQCAAAAHCPLANALAYESGIVGFQAGMRRGSQRSTAVRRQALAYRAADERNAAAGQALEAFYLLAEAEANRDFLARGKTQIDAMLEEVRDLESRGIRVEKGTADFRRQQLELSDRQAELQLALAQANSRLRQLMGWSFEEHDPHLAGGRLEGDRRSDRRRYGRVRRTLSTRRPQSAPHVAGVSRRGLLGRRPWESCGDHRHGRGARPLNCLLRADSGDELDSRHRQLNDLLTRHELAAAEEIRLAVVTIRIRLQQVALAKRTVDHFRDQLQVQRLLRQRPGSTVTALDIAAADLKLLDAQRGLAHQVMALRIAQVKLEQSQGLLVFECSGCR